MVESAPLVAVAATRARGVQTGILTRFFGADEQQGGAVNDARAVTTVVNVVDLLDEVVLLQRHGVEAARFAETRERRVQFGEIFGSGARAHVLVVVENDKAVDVADRHDGLGEVAAGGCLRCEVLRADRVCVDIVAAEALDRGDEVSADALRDEVGVVAGRRVHCPCAAVAAHGNAGHRLDAACDDEVVEAGPYLLRSEVHGFEAQRRTG